MVLQAGLAGLLSAAWRRHRHRDRQPDRGPHRCGAGRSDRVLRQHAGAAHRHLGQSELPRADRPGAGPQPCGLRPSGAAVRAAGRGAEPGAVAVAASAVPGDAGVRGGRGGRSDAGAAGACGDAAADRDREREVRPVGRAGRAQRSPTARRRGIDGVLEYASDLFDAATVEALGPRLIRLLEAAVADAGAAARASLPILERGRARHHPARAGTTRRSRSRPRRCRRCLPRRRRARRTRSRWCSRTAR